MRTLLLIISFTMLSVLSGKGQTTFGLKGGLNASYMSIDMRETLLSFHAGGFCRIPFSGQYFLQPEVLYSVKGAKFPEYFYPFDLNFTLQYISVPVMFGWQATDRLSILAGPEFSILANALIEIGEEEVRGTDGFASWDLSLDLGVAYQFTKRLSAELRYGYGFVNVVDIVFTDENGLPIGVLNEGKNRTIQLSLNYVLASPDQAP